MPENEADSLATPAAGGRAPMSDAEVICSWMEPKPTMDVEVFVCYGSNPRPQWWCAFWDENWMWAPVGPTLDALWEVEERLTDEQGQQYVQALGLVWPKDLLHATPEQKIKALAAVLRPLVTEAPRPDGRGASKTTKEPIYDPRHPEGPPPGEAGMISVLRNQE